MTARLLKRNLNPQKRLRFAHGTRKPCRFRSVTERPTSSGPDYSRLMKDLGLNRQPLLKQRTRTRRSDSMFKGIGQIASMMKNLPKMKAAMEELQQKMGQLVAEGSSGGNMVTAKVNGRMEVVSCNIGE